MARDAVDIKEALSARIMRPRAVQRVYTDQVCAAKEDPGNAAVTGELDAEKKETKG